MFWPRFKSTRLQNFGVFWPQKKKPEKSAKSPKNRRFHRKLPEISSNRLSVEDIVSTSTDKRKIGDISPIFGEILFLRYRERARGRLVLETEVVKKAGLWL